MRRNKAMRSALFIAAAALYISIPATTAKADTMKTEQGVAGFAYLLDNYYSTSEADTVTADKTLINILKTEIISPYANLGVSVADNYVNVRSKPSTDSDVVGKLYRGCAADILEYLDGDWVKIKSGDVEGYIASNFLAIGRDAEAMIDEYATQYATVNTQTLRVRQKMSLDSDILTLIPQGETYVVAKDHGEWVEIVLGADDNGGDFTGFVSKQYIEMKVEFKYAISIAEEQRILREQQEAEQAEAERKAKLAEEEAERKEEARKAQEASEDSGSSKDDSSNDSSGSSGSSSSHSELRSEIINYAQKFVGNRYVWGGVSLTKGADCSGFVQAIYGDFGYYIPRVSRDQASSAGKKVSESDMLPGDLVFYASSGGTVNHVAMYIGNGMIVHAANSRQGIIRSNVKYRDIYCVRRIVY